MVRHIVSWNFKPELSEEERAWKRPKLIVFNLILTAVIIVALVMGLASVIIGQVIFGDRGIVGGLISAAAGSLLYRIMIQAAYMIDMPSDAVKLLSTLIVVAALALPLLKKKLSGNKKGGDSL